MSLVNLFATQARLTTIDGFSHPLLRRRIGFEPSIATFLEGLKAITIDLVVNDSDVQHRERRGRLVLEALFGEMVADPGRMIPHMASERRDHSASNERCVCDHVAGMTDAYAERLYGCHPARKTATPSYERAGRKTPNIRDRQLRLAVQLKLHR